VIPPRVHRAAIGAGRVVWIGRSGGLAGWGWPTTLPAWRPPWARPPAAVPRGMVEWRVVGRM